MVTTVDVAVVGAGPYGLSCAAHLQSADVTVFGEAMSFWRDHMPSGMFLRSPAGASSLCGPGRGFRLEDYERAHGIEPARPVPLQTFIDYGSWFRRRAVPELDSRAVAEIVRDGTTRFRVTLEDGDEIDATSIVVAAGIEQFAWRPPTFAGLPATLASHSVDHDRFDRFRGQRVVVIGAGQSAIESAALLHEAGADVAVVARTGFVNWLVRSGRLHKTKALKRLLYGPSDIGPAGVSWLVELPDVFRRIPRRAQDPLAARAIRPAASHWLVPRTKAVAIHLGRTILAAKESDGRARLDLDDGSNLECDHVLLATGYRVDISRYPFLSPALVAQVARVAGYPKLGSGFCSSVSGLHFVGAPAAWSFGPLFRFVAGTAWAAPRVAASVHASRPRAAHGRHAAAHETSPP